MVPGLWPQEREEEGDGMKTRIGFLMLKRLEVGKGQATKDELAEFCGTSQFYLKEILRKMRARGIITIEKDVVRAKSCSGLFMRGNKLFLLDERQAESRRRANGLGPNSRI